MTNTSTTSTKEVRNIAIAANNIEIRKAAYGKRSISGYAIKFGQASADLGGFIEFVSPTALDRTLKENPDVLLLRDHDSSKLLGRTIAGNLSLKVNSSGLHFDATLLDTSTASDTYLDIQAGLLSGCSFGFCTRDDKWEQGPDGQLIRTLLDVDLHEISVTSFPAYQSTTVDARNCPASLRSLLKLTTPKREDDDTIRAAHMSQLIARMR
jgi:uncharacterized protein